MNNLREEIIRQIVQGAKDAGCELPQTEMIVRSTLVIDKQSKQE